MIRSRANAHLKDMRRARRCKDDLALLEGPHLLREALEAGLVPESVLATPAFLGSDAGRALVAALPHPPRVVEPALLEPLADSDTPRGILAVVRPPSKDLMRLPAVAGGHYLFLDGVQDPGNLGALARVAEAAGVSGLALATGCAHPNHPRALRASAGSLLRLPVAMAVTAAAVRAQLGPVAPTWIGLAAHGGEDLYQASLTGTLVLALGAEARGLSASVEKLCERRATIPLATRVESLNVATAAAIVLFELRRRKAVRAGLQPE